ncbi:MAG: LuxR C-terminal-related transcriptional regulator [Serratia sp. (in: enterobacteria)]|uniref:LuxR C-terminal-related transcriptional regulator n=1 Tax=Serratia sp. (in: enterobacteria) TaxID=616 RepID=UPI003F3AD349
MENLLYPLSIQQLSLEAYNRQAPGITRTRSVLLIDTSVTSHSLINSVYHNLDVIFLHNTPHDNVTLSPFSVNFHALHIGMPLEKFCKIIINILSGNPQEVMSKKKDRRLTVKEEYVFRESLKGISVRELSTACGIAEKSVHTHRRNACRKLGVNKIKDVLPFHKFFDETKKQSLFSEYVDLR